MLAVRTNTALKLYLLSCNRLNNRPDERVLVPIERMTVSQ